MNEISVLIPTFNRASFLTRVFNTLKLQTFSDFHIVVYDDGSTDNTKDVINSFGNITYHYNKDNRGVSHARNQLVSLCPTKYGVFHDSDDVSNIFRIEELYKTILKEKCAVVNSCFDKYDLTSKYELAPYFVDKDWKFSNRGGGATIMFERDKAVLFNEDLHWGEDSLWRDTMNSKYGKEYLIKKILYYVDFCSSNRLGRTVHKGQGYYSGRGFINEN